MSSFDTGYPISRYVLQVRSAPSGAIADRRVVDGPVAESVLIVTSLRCGGVLLWQRFSQLRQQLVLLLP